MVRSSLLPPPAVYVTSVGEKLPSIPGYKTSAAFLTSLSANLRLPDDDLLLQPSPLSTPNVLRPHHANAHEHPSLFALPSPSSPFSLWATTLTTTTTTTMASPPATNAASADTSSPSAGGPPIPSDLPELTTTTATDPTDRIAAVRLIADSVAQQRQTAARTLITHPLPLSLHILLLSLLSARLYRTPSDLPLLFTTAAGATMAALVAARWLVAGYIAAAEAISPAGWLADADAVIVTKWGRNIIGAVVLGFSPAPASPPSSPGSGGRRRNRHGGSGGGGGGAAGERALVRAWTVQRKYRGQGVGGALLDEAVRVARARGGKNREGEVLEFAEEHANSARLLPTKPVDFNAVWDHRDDRAIAALDRRVAAARRGGSPTSGRRR